MHLLKSSTLLGASIGSTALSLLGPIGRAQEVAPTGGITVTMAGVSATVPEIGRTEQLNVSQGQRTTLSVGNSVTWEPVLNSPAHWFGIAQSICPRADKGVVDQRYWCRSRT